MVGGGLLDVDRVAVGVDGAEGDRGEGLFDGPAARLGAVVAQLEGEREEGAGGCHPQMALHPGRMGRRCAHVSSFTVGASAG